MPKKHRSCCVVIFMVNPIYIVMSNRLRDFACGIERKKRRFNCANKSGKSISHMPQTIHHYRLRILTVIYCWRIFPIGKFVSFTPTASMHCYYILFGWRFFFFCRMPSKSRVNLLHDEPNNVLENANSQAKKEWDTTEEYTAFIMANSFYVRDSNTF